MGRRLVRRRSRPICVRHILVPTGPCAYLNHGLKAMLDIQKIGARRPERISGSLPGISGQSRIRDILRRRNARRLHLIELSRSLKQLPEWKLTADMKLLFFLESWKTL